MEYEYTIEQHILLLADTVPWLNSLGEQGWELVAVVNQQSQELPQLFVFKRPIP